MAAKTDMNCYEAGKRPLPPHVERMPASTMDTRKSRLPNPAPNLMRFRECAQDGGVCVKTIARWVERGLLTEWRPHPKSRTRRIKRAVWEAFKHRAL